MVIKALARAKINLTLDVLGERPDGYHDVEMVMQTIDLHDCLEFIPQDGDIDLAVEGYGVPVGEDNLVFRAAFLLKHQTGVKSGVSIRLKKNIPVAAGLGGGSADAAATLISLNQLWGTGLSLSELMSLGEQLGSDIPFCLLGGTALARGRGERLEPLPPCPRLALVLVKPSFGLSTAAVYGSFRPETVSRRPDNQEMIKAIREGKVSDIINNLANVLESTAINIHPQIAGIKERLLQAGVLGVLMSGSGPTVFGVAPDLENGRKAAERYKNTDDRVMVAETYNPGS